MWESIYDAKPRFYVEINGLPFDIPLPNPEPANSYEFDHEMKEIDKESLVQAASSYDSDEIEEDDEAMLKSNNSKYSPFDWGIENIIKGDQHLTSMIAGGR